MPEIIYNHLIVNPDNAVIRKDTWRNRLVKKYFDIPFWKESTYSYLGKETLLINNYPVVKRFVVPEVFACCGLQQFAEYGITYSSLIKNDNVFSLIPFWEEYYKEFRLHCTMLHCTIPTLLIVAQYSDSRGFMYGELDRILVENSVRLMSFRNVRYEDHILHLQMMYHPAGTDSFLDAATKVKPIITFPESFLP